METHSSLTEGKVSSVMMRFAVPYLLANLLQAAYGAADLWIVGRFSDAAGLSAVATGSQVMQTLISLIAGLTTGGTVLIGRYLGERRRGEVSDTIGTMFSVFAILAGVLTVLMTALARPIAAAMQSPVEAFAPTVQYIFICSCGIFFLFGYNAMSAILRGMGDSKSPLVFVAVACVCNVAGDLFLVGGLRMGAAGAAAATAVSQGISMLLAVFYLKKRNFIFDFRLKSFRIHPAKARNLFRIGLPISLQDTLVMLSFLFIMAIVNRMGVTASAAVGVTEKLNTFTMLAPGAFSAAIAAAVAQNMGAEKPQRARRCLGVGIRFSLVCGIACFVVLQIAPAAVMHLFTPDAAVAAEGARYLRSFSADCVLVCFVFCLNGFFNGCGHTAFSMANNLLATFLIRVPAAYLFSRLAGATLFEIGLAAPLASAFSIVLGLWYLKTGKWVTLKLE